MRVLILSTWHRRCGAWYYARAFRQLGHDVLTVGPWQEEEPFGTHGREPLARLPRQGGPDPQYSWQMVERGCKPDLFLLIDGGEGLRVDQVPAGIPWAHISSEGARMEWSRGHTRARFAHIMCNGADADVRWLPNAFDVVEHDYGGSRREYDLVQLASARRSRQRVWDAIPKLAPDLHVAFGDIWGPMYSAAYKEGLLTWVCSNQDFVTTRVFEAMAMGCIVMADATPSLLSLFRDGEHFISYTPVMGEDGEGYPDPQELIDQVRWMREHPEATDRMRTAAYELVVKQHSFFRRAHTILDAVTEPGVD